jgi:D-xylose transport system substrate-binding protein
MKVEHLFLQIIKCTECHIIIQKNTLISTVTVKNVKRETEQMVMKKIREKLVAVIGVVSLLIILGSCQSSSDVKLGFLIHSLSNTRWQTDLKFLTEHSKELNAELVVRSADMDENVQLEQAKELLEQGVKVLIVVAVNQNIAAAIVREAHEYNVPVISYDRFIMNSDLDYLVSFQYGEIGKMMIDYAVSKKPQGNYVVLFGEATDANALFIKEAQIKALQPHADAGRVNIVFKGHIEDWSAENTKFLLTKTIDYSNQKIDAVIAGNAVLAKAAYEVLSNYNMQNDVLITSMDISLETYKLIRQGNVSMSAYKPLKSLAYTAIDLAVNVAKGKKSEKQFVYLNNGRVEVPSLLLAPILVEANNIRTIAESEQIFKPEELAGLD